MKNGNGITKNGNGLQPKIRCAIYTRKSTEEGLDQEFNSLDAQREAAESFIASQRSEGWVALTQRYDDGGFSGGTMERPALKRLLQDIEERRIDCVVVYKVDRLSRSLLDFTKIVETFERQGVTFVSVTQAFNTTTSMGRLTLNILLSFAQFEREIIGERIRDKMAAAKRKGKYTGGMPILGYDVDRVAKKLIVNPEEAKLVRNIFKRFVQLQSATSLSRELNEKGHRTKSWTTMKGVVRAGQPWHKMHLYRLFNNRIYVGEIVHMDNVYQGEHEAIVPRDLFNKVQDILEENCKVRGNNARAKTPALLKGLIKCGHCGGSMGPSFTKKNGKTYRYYVCIQATKKGWDTCPVKNVAAGEIEGAVMAQMRAVFQSPELIAETCRIARQKESEEIERLKNERFDLAGELPTASNPLRQRDINERIAEIDTTVAAMQANPLSEQQVANTLNNLDAVWDELFPAEQSRIVSLLVERVVVSETGAEVIMRSDGLHSLVDELDSREERIGADG
ncbi:MAG: recombinase family protein [Deltaproteobacteria bacterium]|nr:recombinase family protein [Deltaproteobacteria bacterium]